MGWGGKVQGSISAGTIYLSDVPKEKLFQLVFSLLQLFELVCY